MKRAEIKRGNNFKFVIILTIILIILISAALFYFIKPQTTGNLILANESEYLDIGFTSPASTDQNPGDFYITPEYADIQGSNSLVLNASVDNVGGLVYNIGYYYSNVTDDWVAFNFTGLPVGDSPWLSDSAYAQISIPRDALRIDRKNLILAYACKKDASGEWKCGCDANGICGNWKMQIFMVNDTGAPCVPQCINTANYLVGQNFSDSCGGMTCVGTKDPCDGTPAVGTVCADGTVYVTSTLRTMLSDAGQMDWNTAVSTCTGKGTGWVLPSSNQLNTLYNNKVAIGNFNISGNCPGSCYWSTNEFDSNKAQIQFFGSLFGDMADLKTNTNNVRCVRNIIPACSGGATDPNCWSTKVSGKVWGPMTIYTSVKNTTTGATNTAALVRREIDYPGESYPAARYCDNLSEGGYTDWYLPAKDQLWTGWTGLGSGGFSSGSYWSSTADEKGQSNYAFVLDTRTVPQMGLWDKNGQLSVRCLRGHM